jgi:predicted metalloprotease with PDZ domain
VLVTAVDPGSAGAAAGLKPGDVIARFDGRPVSTPQELSTRLGSATAGKTVDLQIVRDRTPRALRVTLADPTEATESEAQVTTAPPLTGGASSYGRSRPGWRVGWESRTKTAW